MKQAEFSIVVCCLLYGGVQAFAHDTPGGDAAVHVAQATDSAVERIPPIPEHAGKAEMSRPNGRWVTLDGKPMVLAPGAHIRDENNRIVLPSHVRGPVTVRYTLDARREIKQVWIVPSE